MSRPKSRVEPGVCGVALELVDQQLGREHVDAHAGQCSVRLVRHTRRVVRFFDEGGDAVVLVHRHHAEAAGFQARHLDAAYGDVGAALNVLRQHFAVVHFVDMVAGQQDHVLRVVAFDDVDVLVHRVGGAFVPAIPEPLGGGQDIETLVAFRAEEVPAALHVADQAVRLVLGGDADAADAGVQRIGQREINDPALAAEIHRRLGADVGELLQPRAAAAGQHIGHGGPHERGTADGLLAHGRGPPGDYRNVIRAAKTCKLADAGK